MSYRWTNVVGGGTSSVSIASWEHPLVWEFVGKGRYLQAAFCKSAAQLYSAKFGLYTTKSLSNSAAEGGLIGLVEWSKDIGCCWDESVFRSGARGGSMVVLKFLKKNVCPIPTDASLCRIAGAGGHLEALEFLRDKCCCVWDATFCEAVAHEGRLEILQYAHAQHFACFEWDNPGWNSRIVCRVAVSRGHTHILEWAYKTLNEDGLFDAANMCEAAACAGRLDVLQYLRGIGCEWDENTCWTAVSYGHVGVLKWAVDNGCPWAVNDRGPYGETGLHHAKNVELIDFLISLGADIDAVDRFGRTPVYTVITTGSLEAVKTLVRIGADVNIAEFNGSTPLGVAINKDLEEIAAMLRDAGAE